MRLAKGLHEVGRFEGMSFSRDWHEVCMRSAQGWHEVGMSMRLA